MNLGTIYTAREVWSRLVTMRINPRMAYTLLKYLKLFVAEVEIIEKQRIALIHEITNTVEGQEAKIEPNTPEFVDYVNRFNAVLLTDSDLKKCNIPFDDLLKALHSEEGNDFTVQELMALELFFEESEVK